MNTAFCFSSDWYRTKPEVEFFLKHRLLCVVLLLGCLFAGKAFAGYQGNISNSYSSDRSGASPLAGQTVQGNVHLFLSLNRTNRIRSVKFYIDDPKRTQSPYRIDTNTPYDLVGGNTQTATPFDTSTLSNGGHTITAVIESTKNTIISASFIVDNQLTGQLSSSTATLDFGEQLKDTTSTTQVVTLTNTGEVPVTIQDPAINNDDFRWTSNTCGTVAIGESCAISLSFTPTVAGLQNGTLTIFSDADHDALAVNLTGIGTTPMVDIRLLWDASPDAVTDYTIYYGPTEDAVDTLYVSLSLTDIDPQAPATDLTVEEGMPVCFGVSAGNDYGESGLSNIVCIN